MFYEHSKIKVKVKKEVNQIIGRMKKTFNPAKIEKQLLEIKSLDLSEQDQDLVLERLFQAGFETTMFRYILKA